MKATLRPFVLTIASTLALAGSTAAQELSGEIVRNPDTTVTYTIDLDGPPNGFTLPLFTLQTSLTPPYQLPGFFNPLYLDLTTALAPLPILPLDPFGQSTIQFTLPSNIFNGVPIYSQYIAIDTNFAFAMTNLTSLLAEETAGIPGLQCLQIWNDSAQSLRADVCGTPGTQVEFQHWSGQGQLKGITQTVVPPTGNAQVSLGVGQIEYGDQTHVIQDLGFGPQLYRTLPWHN